MTRKFLHTNAVLAALDEAMKEAVAQLAQLQYGGPVLLFARDLQDLDTDISQRAFPGSLKSNSQACIVMRQKRLSKTLKAPTPERAHRFRISLKHLRYSCEFFAPLFDNDEMVEYSKVIAGLQDAFGFINDFHVARSDCKAGWRKQ